MSDAIVKTGTVRITADEIVVEGFTFDMNKEPLGTFASDLARKWAIDRLREVANA